MDVFTVDFETYYSNTYSLTRLGYEEYVNHPEFQIIMIGVKKNDEPTEILSCGTAEEYKRELEKRGVHKGAVLCHNTMFDGIILQEILGIVPPMYLDTMCMAQVLHKPHHKSISLANCLKHENSPLAKGTYVGNMLGRRKETLSPQEFQKYSEYCADDCDGEYWLFQKLKPQLPRDEFLMIDITLRMYLEAKFELDLDMLKQVLQDARDKHRRLMDKLPASITPTLLASNPKFAQVLEKLGVDVPMKISPTTLKPTYAFAKTDPEWKDLEDEYADDDIVGPVLAARLGVKSTIAETRATRFIKIAQDYGKLRVPLRYYGAHTGRYSGMEGINCQNLPRIPQGTKTDAHLRNALRAPKGHLVLSSDLSQIECRVTAWLAECRGLLQVFRDKGDPYCAFGTKVFGRVITKADVDERFISKTCILGLGFGTGHLKLQATLRKDGHKVSAQEAQKYVWVYRDTYHEIPALWRLCDRVIEQMATGDCMQMIGPVCATKDRLTLPNGLALWYNNLRFIDTRKYRGWVFDFAGRTKPVWGGVFTENLAQALARTILTTQTVAIRKEIGIRPSLNVHDELVFVVPEARAEEYKTAVEEIMRRPVDWANGLIIETEAALGETYGGCK